MLTNKIKELEKLHKVKVLLVTKVGSHLYGTNDENSDIDYKGIFLPSKDSLLLDDSTQFLDLSTNKSNSKNTSEDIDFTLQSVQKWFKDLCKGETGALDLLFSMWTSSVTYVNEDFLTFVKSNYKYFLTNKPKAFIGYANQQAKKYSLKKERYNELVSLLGILTRLSENATEVKLLSCWEEIKSTIEAKDFQYINFVLAPGPKKTEECEYLEVLGRKFHPTVTFEFLLNRLGKVKEEYGNRAKRCESPTEWKSLSHAVRVVDEIEELLHKQFITFPLPNANFVKQVKQGKVLQDEVTSYLDDKLSSVDKFSKLTKLPVEPNKQPFINWLKYVYVKESEC